jgi:hypothetical protein
MFFLLFYFSKKYLFSLLQNGLVPRIGLEPDGTDRVRSEAVVVGVPEVVVEHAKDGRVGEQLGLEQLPDLGPILRNCVSA